MNSSASPSLHPDSSQCKVHTAHAYAQSAGQAVVLTSDGGRRANTNYGRSAGLEGSGAVGGGTAERDSEEAWLEAWLEARLEVRPTNRLALTASSDPGPPGVLISGLIIETANPMTSKTRSKHRLPPHSPAWLNTTRAIDVIRGMPGAYDVIGDNVTA